jgi:hypothetical protein
MVVAVMVVAVMVVAGGCGGHGGGDVVWARFRPFRRRCPPDSV